MIAREGYTFILYSAIVATGVSVLAVWLLEGMPGIVVVAVAVLLVAAALGFFRDPERAPPRDAGMLLLAPADGRIIAIEEEEEPLYLRGPARRITIFLSVFSVHVNRIPAAGVLEFDEYVPGDYRVAWHPKASDLNERSQLGLRHESGHKVLFKQIAGLVARRIVYHVTEGDAVAAGQRLGIIKLGSRMDVIVAPEVALAVRVGERVRAGETIMGRFGDVPRQQANA